MPPNMEMSELQTPVPPNGVHIAPDYEHVKLVFLMASSADEKSTKEHFR